MPIFPGTVDSGILLTGDLTFLNNFWACIVLLANVANLNLLLVTPPENVTKLSLSTLEELLAILKVSISTFLTKYSSSAKSNLLLPSPAAYLIFCPVINPWLGIVILVLSLNTPVNVRSVCLISKPSSR